VGLSGLYAVAALLLGVGAVAKVLAPASARRALADIGLRVPSGLVRAGALVEAALAASALAISNRVVAGAIALVFFTFFLFTLVAIRRPTTVRSCGCFGRADSPSSTVHVVINLTCAGIAAGAGATGTESVRATLWARPGLAVPYAALVLLATWFAYLCLSELSGLMALIRSQPGQGG
jgi:hypothetical protein